jgi:hypothetical protein
MEHVAMGTILLIIAFCMILGAILTAPKLERIGIRHSARYSFAIVCILTGTYLGWIGTVFLRIEYTGGKTSNDKKVEWQIPLSWQKVQKALDGGCTHEMAIEIFTT